MKEREVGERSRDGVFVIRFGDNADIEPMLYWLHCQTKPLDTVHSQETSGAYSTERGSNIPYEAHPATTV